MSNFWELIKNFFLNPPLSSVTGVIEDNRSPSQIDKDHLHEEYAVATPVNPFSNTQITTSDYFYENQFSTSSCVPHGTILGLAILRKQVTGYFQRLSQMFPYRLRMNYAQEGSSLPDIFEILRKRGSPLWDSLPTPREEFQANNVVITTQQYTEADISKGLEYRKVTDFNSIDELASIAQQGLAVTILIFAQEDEWALNYPFILYPKLLKENAVVRHCVTILPRSGFIKDGVKYVTVQDSAWFGGWKIRHLSEYFIRSRVYDCRYWTSVATLGGGKPPKYVFSKTLQVGFSGEDVKALQKLLISEFLLPNDCATGVFGGKTLAAVKAFQSKYANEILTPSGLTSPTGMFGPASIRKANVLCG